jgi:hypothetical protein
MRKEIRWFIPATAPGIEIMAGPAAKVVSEKQKRLWNALEEFCRQQGAWVVSIPHHRNLRIEIVKDSKLPAELTRLGYAPCHVNSHIRIVGGKFLPVDVVEISLPGK